MAFEQLISQIDIPASVLSMVNKELMEKRSLMPISFDSDTGILTIVTSNYQDVTTDIAFLEILIKKIQPNIKGISVEEVSYENFVNGYNFHYKIQFTPTVNNKPVTVPVEKEITSEQTKLADEILNKAIKANASDIHITPLKDTARVQYRIDGKLRDPGFTLTKDDEITICNFYRRRAKISVNNLVPSDGRFYFAGRAFRLSTMPYGDSGERNKVVLRLLASGGSVTKVENLGFSNDEIDTLKRLAQKPSGIMLICGPTGEGKTTTLYSLISEINDKNEKIIISYEDPIERYIDGIAQSQMHDAEDSKNKYDFARGMRSGLRQDPNVMLVGEIRDAETALIAVQASQTGHMIFSTLHVRNSISVFRRLSDLGANVSGFAEQIVGIASQRLLTKLCPYCKVKIDSPLNNRIRQSDLQLLEDGKYSYVSKGCKECNGTGYSGRVPIIEIIEFNNYLRDYFAEKHGLIEIEKHLREKFGFQSLWDKGLNHVINGDVSLEELLGCIEPDEEIENVFRR